MNTVSPTLIEIPHIRQNAGELPRRWFRSPTMELYLWMEGAAVAQFLLSCREGPQEFAIEWSPTAGLHCRQVDDGEQSVFKNRTPILHKTIHLDLNAVAEAFALQAGVLPSEVREFVLQHLR